MRSTSVLSVLTISLLTLLGCSNDQTPTTKNTETPAASSGSPTEASPSTNNKQLPQIPSKSVAIGQSIKLGKYQFTVNGVRETPGDTISQPKPGQKFIVIDATVENQGPKQEAISSIFLFGLSDSTNKELD